MTEIFPLIAVVTVAGLLYSHKTNNRRLEWIFKPATSALFILTALASGIDGTYATLIFAGLICGFVGDVLLIPDSQKPFIAGLVIFLLGHVLYTIAFNDLIPFTNLKPLVMLVFVIFGMGTYIFLYRHLGEMKISVFAYVVVITVMVFAALAVYFETDLSRDFRRLVAIGAICFYLSDLGVALDRFVNVPFKQSYWSLPLYYAAQFMLALSVGVIKQ